MFTLIGVVLAVIISYIIVKETKLKKKYQVATVVVAGIFGWFSVLVMALMLVVKMVREQYEEGS